MWVKDSKGQLINLHTASMVGIRETEGRYYLYADLPFDFGDEANRVQLTMMSGPAGSCEAALEDIEDGINTGAVLVDLMKRETFNVPNVT